MRLIIAIIIILPLNCYSANITLSASSIASKSSQAVVTIQTYDSSGNKIGLGTGFFISKDGVIVTNKHVIEKASIIELTLSDGTTINDLNIIATDEKLDIAILKAKINILTVLKLSEAKQKQGEKVYVIGNPLGLERTISDGIISAFRKDSGVEYIQFTAPISPGSSGGPVINSEGLVIGMATMIILNGQNLNLAIPVKYVKSCMSKAVLESNAINMSHANKKKYDNISSEIDRNLSDKIAWSNTDWSNIENNSLFNKILDKFDNDIVEIKNTPISQDKYAELVDKDIFPYKMRKILIKLFDNDTKLVYRIHKDNNKNRIQISIANTNDIFNDILRWAQYNFGNYETLDESFKGADGDMFNRKTYEFVIGKTLLHVSKMDNVVFINFIKNAIDNRIGKEIKLTCSINIDNAYVEDKVHERTFIVNSNDKYDASVKDFDRNILFNQKAATTDNTIKITKTDSDDKVKATYYINRNTGKVRLILSEVPDVELKGECTSPNTSARKF